MKQYRLSRKYWIYIVGAILALSQVKEVHAESTQAAAGAAVVVEQYYKVELPSKEEGAQEITTALEDIFLPIEGYTNLGIANVTESLNIRETPVDGAVVGRLPKDAACEIISEENGWCYIESGDISGYVSSEFLLMNEEALKRAHEVMVEVATVNADALYLREQPNTESNVLDILNDSEKLEVVTKEQEWAKVVVDDTEGYVSMEFVKLTPELQTARTLAQMQYGMEVSQMRVEMAEFAQQFVGYPYVYGGNSLTNGTDCSGFTHLIYQHFGISIPRTATTQYNYGTKISVDELLPGDLIIYGEYQIEHVGMYIGDGMIVHASNERTGIRYSEMNYRNIIGCVRVMS